MLPKEPGGIYSPGYDGNRMLQKPKEPRYSRLKVICMECSTKFWTNKMIPECPGCGGSDIEPTF